MATKLTALGVPIALLVLMLVLIASGGSPAAPPTEGDDGRAKGHPKGYPGDSSDAIARLKDADGNFVGVVRFEYEGDEVEVKARLKDVAPVGEFHGFHVHATGQCDPNAVDPATGVEVPFFSAGGISTPTVRYTASTRATFLCYWYTPTATRMRDSIPIALGFRSFPTRMAAQ